jgi:hypothetical protein
VQHHCVVCTRCHRSFHTIQCFHRVVMEKFHKQRRVSLYSRNCAKFTVGIVADRRGGGAVLGAAEGTCDDILIGER